MGSNIEMNDTLQLTSEQGFPHELNFDAHTQSTLSAEQFSDKVFSFRNKPGIRVFKAPPVRNFLVHNIDGKWLYWGLVHIIEITHDYEMQTTSGKFRITYLYSPEEMKKAYDLIDRDKEKSYFS